MKHLILTTVAVLMLFSCAKESLISITQLDEQEKEIFAISSNGIAQNFTITIENVAGDASLVTPFAPGVWMVQKKNSAPMFQDGDADFGDGLEALAEDGSPGMLNNALSSDAKVRSNGVFNTPVGAAGPAPIFPGEAYSFQITAKPNDYLNFATMFIQSNDLFIGPDQQGIALFDGNGNAISGDITAHMSLWDAGTEINEEPGVGPNQAPRQSGPDTGADENGPVQVVNDGFDYPSVNSVVKVVIHPMD